jgi:hypothetical protein
MSRRFGRWTATTCCDPATWSRFATPPTPSAPSRAGREARRQQRVGLDGHLERLLSEPHEHLLRALGPAPEDRVSRERWEREARGLEALRLRSNTTQHPASSPSQASRASERRQGPSAPARELQRHRGPAIGR